MTYNDLKETLNKYNWDDGFEVPEKILKNQNCDLALALEIFFLADGFAYLDNMEKEKQTGSEEWRQFIDNLYNDILNGKYPKTGNCFKNPLTKVARYKFGKKSVPEIFLLDL